MTDYNASQQNSLCLWINKDRSNWSDKLAVWLTDLLGDYWGTLPSNNDDANENVVEKQTSHPFKLFHDYLRSLNYLKERN